MRHIVSGDPLRCHASISLQQLLFVIGLLEQSTASMASRTFSSFSSMTEIFVSSSSSCSMRHRGREAAIQMRKKRAEQGQQTDKIEANPKLDFVHRTLFWGSLGFFLLFTEGFSLCIVVDAKPDAASCRMINV